MELRQPKIGESCETEKMGKGKVVSGTRVKATSGKVSVPINAFGERNAKIAINGNI